MRKTIRWLHQEIDTWQQEGLVEPGQADALRRRYPVPETRPVGRLILSALGAVIIGLGVILFFAYNWQDMPKEAKLGVLFVALISAHAGGLWQQVKGASARLSVEVLHLLGTMFFGAGIWLVSQIYHFDNPYPGAFVLWGLGALGLAWALPSIPQALLALVLFLAWMLSDFGGQVETWTFATSGLIVIGLAPLAALQRSRALTLAIAAAMLVVLPVELAQLGKGFEGLITLLLAGLALTYVALAHLANDRALSPGLRGLGHFVYFVLIFIASFNGALSEFGSRPENGLHWLGFTLILVIPLSLMAAALLRSSAQNDFLPIERRFWSNAFIWQLLMMAMMLFLALVQLHVLPSDHWWHALPATLALLAHGVILVLDGTRQSATGRATVGALLIAVVTMARFSDLFDSLLARSLAFLVIGAGFVAAGAFFNRHKEARSEEEAHHA